MAAIAPHYGTRTRPYSTLALSVLLLSLILILPSAQVGLQRTASLLHTPDLGRLPLSFEPNAGQADPATHYTVHTSGGTLLFTSSGILMSLPGEAQGKAAGSATLRDGHPKRQPEQPLAIVGLRFVGADPAPRITNGQPLPGKVSYFLGKDPSAWRSGLSTYSTITYAGLYPGISLDYSGTDGLLKGTYNIEALADAAQIRWRYDGADKVIVDEAGNLQITLNNSKLTEQAPVAWQQINGQQVAVSVRYEIAGDGSIGFVLGKYDHSQALVIDPTIIYSTYLGGFYGDGAGGIALDREGNIYVSGTTGSSDFPVANGYQSVYGGGKFDTFISKLSADGSTLLHSTFIGGDDWDVNDDIGLDSAGNVTVGGWTSSENFPTTANAIQTEFGGTEDGYVAKLDADLTRLVYGTYYGGCCADEVYGFTTDAAGNAYVSGITFSPDMPTANPFQNYHCCDSDAFVGKISPDGSNLIFGSYLGGRIPGPGDENANDGGDGIAVDGTGNMYVTGYTRSRDFPVSSGAYRTFIQAFEDGFITKFSPTGQSLGYSTYIPGGVSDYPMSIAADQAGNAYITGNTSSSDYPTTPGAFQRSSGDPRSAFLTKLNPSGSALVFSSFLGGPEFYFETEDYGLAVRVNDSGNAYVAGYTSAPDFPLLDPIQDTLRGPSDAFLTKFNTTGTGVEYSTYLGGTSGDGAGAIDVDNMGGVYLAGGTSSTNFPVVNPLQPTNHGGGDAFIVQIAEAGAVTRTRTPTQTGTPHTATPTSTPGNCQMPSAWRAEVPMSLARAHAAAGVLDNKLYVIGGSAPSPSPFPRRVERYDPATNSWTTLAPIPIPPAYKAAAAVGSKLYTVVLNAGSTQGYMQIYDAPTDTWTSGAAMPEVLANGGLAAYNGKVYIFGGQYPGLPSNHVYEYDPATNTITSKAPMPTGQSEIGAATVGNRIYVVGGWQYIHYAYDPATDTWSTIAAPPVPSFVSPGVFAFNGEVWVEGGYDNVTRRPYPPDQQVQIYSPATNSWRFGPRFATPRYYSSSAGAIGNRAYVVGGIDFISVNYPYDYLNDMESLSYVPCGSVTPTATPSCPHVVQDVVIQTFAFEPRTVTIQVGSTIRWTNYDTASHTATGTNGEWDSGNLAPYQVYVHRFDTPGTYPYHCERHPGMTGTIIVAACPSTVTPQPTQAITTTNTPTVIQTTHTPTAIQTTRTPTAVQTAGSTFTPVRSPTSEGSVTPVPTTCSLGFLDVSPSDYFYAAVRYLYCAGIISGYADGTFRPYSTTTRGQLSKIVTLAEGWRIECSQPPHFSDVPPGNPFFCYIETAYGHGIISGYADGTFRPGNNVTRAQLSKIVVQAEGWHTQCSGPGHFSDVPPSDPFYCYIETAYGHGIISGYADGTFRPGASATRGQISKIIYQAITAP